MLYRIGSSHRHRPFDHFASAFFARKIEHSPAHSESGAAESYRLLLLLMNEPTAKSIFRERASRAQFFT